MMEGIRAFSSTDRSDQLKFITIMLLQEQHSGEGREGVMGDKRGACIKKITACTSGPTCTFTKFTSKWHASLSSYCTMSHNMYIHAYIDKGPCIVKSLQHPLCTGYISTPHMCRHAHMYVHILINTSLSPHPQHPCTLPRTSTCCRYHTSHSTSSSTSPSPHLHPHLTHHQLPFSKGPHKHKHPLKVVKYDWLFGKPDCPRWIMLDIISMTSAANICGLGGGGIRGKEGQ